MPSRIRLSRKKGFRLPRDAVSVARPNRWGNPFKIGDKPPYGSEPMTAEDVVKFYKRMFDANPQLKVNATRDLRGKTLACWCPIGSACHGDFLLELVNS